MASGYSDLKKKINQEVYDRRSSGRVPVTTVRTDHAVSLVVAGSTIGHVQSWAPQQARNVTPIYEINAAGQGNVLENVPGISTGLVISVTRFDLYASRMEQVWGPRFDITMLTEQHNPLTITERWENPTGKIEIWTYTGCWFSSLGRNHSASGDRITRVNASLMYVKKYKVSEIDTWAGEAGDYVAGKTRRALDKVF